MATTAHKAIKAAQGPASDGPFTWNLAAGGSLELPSLAVVEVDMGAVEDLISEQDGGNPLIQLGAQLRFLRSFLTAEQGATLRRMKMSEFVEFIAAWGAHSGTTVGELSAS